MNSPTPQTRSTELAQCVLAILNGEAPSELELVRTRKGAQDLESTYPGRANAILAAVALAQGRVEDMWRHIELVPRFADEQLDQSLQYVVLTLLTAGELEAAESRAREYFEWLPQSPILAVTVSTALEHTGKVREAMSFLDEFQDHYPDLSKGTVAEAQKHLSVTTAYVEDHDISDDDLAQIVLTICDLAKAGGAYAIHSTIKTPAERDHPLVFVFSLESSQLFDVGELHAQAIDRLCDLDLSAPAGAFVSFQLLNHGSQAKAA